MKFKQKLGDYVHKKTTFMVIPHSNKGIKSFHLSRLDVLIVSLIVAIIMFLGFFFYFQLSKKSSDYEFYFQENIYYKKQIGNIKKILPKITDSQNSLTNQLDELLNTLGIIEKNNKAKLMEKDNLFSAKYLDNFEGKIANISKYIKNFRALFKGIPSIFPIVSRKFWFTSPYGSRRHPISGRVAFHTGVDIAAFPSTPIQTSANGVVEYAGWRGGYGIVVKVKHEKGYATKYAHMRRKAVKKGDIIKKGEIVGYVGNTGVSTGYHLHYEVLLNNKTVNPSRFLYLDKFWR